MPHPCESSDWKQIFEKYHDIKRIFTIRYMGTKYYSLSHIVPRIISLTRPGGTVFDLMAGTHSVGYALKKRQRVFSNDIQKYSQVIGAALIENNDVNISRSDAERDLKDRFLENMRSMRYNLFYDNYSDTYFSAQQCKVIDSIRYAIEDVDNVYKKSLYLTCLMYAMCYAQSTPGHFAEYLENTPRIIPLRAIDIWHIFLKKCNTTKVLFSRYENKVFCEDFHEFFYDKKLEDYALATDVFYLDPPYSEAQYSRYFHLLETLVLYDYPTISYKGKYRKDRYKSKFCYRNKAPKEFEWTVDKVAELGRPLVISYSGIGLVPIPTLIELAKSRFENVQSLSYRYSYSMQGRGCLKEKREYLITCIP